MFQMSSKMKRTFQAVSIKYHSSGNLSPQGSICFSTTFETKLPAIITAMKICTLLFRYARRT